MPDQNAPESAVDLVNSARHHCQQGLQRLTPVQVRTSSSACHLLRVTCGNCNQCRSNKCMCIALLAATARLNEAAQLPNALSGA